MWNVDYEDGCLDFVHVMFKRQMAGKPLLSVSQLKSGMKQGEMTMVAALVEVETNKVVEVPDCIAIVLNKFSDVMPFKLPKKLSPRRNIDYKIELKPSARPPTRALYHVAPLELAKLRK